MFFSKNVLIFCALLEKKSVLCYNKFNLLYDYLYDYIRLEVSTNEQCKKDKSAKATEGQKVQEEYQSEIAV